MKVTHFTETFSPSSDFSSKLDELATIAAYAKSLNQTELFNQIRSLYDSLVDQYNTKARQSTKRSFFGKVLDNMTWTDRYAQELDHMENNSFYTGLLMLANRIDASERIQKINQFLKKYS